MSKQDMLKKLNFASWLEFYQYLQEQGCEDRLRIVIYPVMVETDPPVPRHPLEFDLVEIKALALDELLAQQPSLAALEVLLDLVRLEAVDNKKLEPVVQFLTKLKSRVK